TEGFFWSFCDDYVELVKNRAYGTDGPGPRSARAALGVSLSIQLRLLAPFLPFVTEEVWSWWHRETIHRAPWPELRELGASIARAEPAVLDVASDVLGAIRRAKTGAKRSMRWPVSRLTVADVAPRLALIEAAASDLRQAGAVTELVLIEGEAAIEVELADEPAGSGS
ncbi:MAG: class I tRNA ligase family protein, partial [Acidimicrobiales bacterium]